MTNSSDKKSKIKRLKIGSWTPNLQSSIFILLLTAALILLLYLLTLASAPVFGDPTEYTVVANQLGFAHPPGYAFITLLGKLAQTLIPFGAVSWRMHLLAALSSLTAALFAFGTVYTIAKHNSQPSQFTIHNSQFYPLPSPPY